MGVVILFQKHRTRETPHKPPRQFGTLLGGSCISWCAGVGHPTATDDGDHRSAKRLGAVICGAAVGDTGWYVAEIDTGISAQAGKGATPGNPGNAQFDSGAEPRTNQKSFIA